METTSHNIEVDVKAIQKELFSKKLEIESLLEITSAINANLEEPELYRVFEFILRAQMSINKMCFFINIGNEKDWRIGILYGDLVNIDKIEINDTLLNIFRVTKCSELGNEILNQFELVVPVHHNNKPLAFAFLGRDTRKKPLNGEETKYIQTITNIIAVAVENKALFREQLKQASFKRELEVAAHMQSLLVPEIFPSDEFIEMAATYLPQQEVGGDYYDYFELNENEIAFCIADVSGKGIPAAILMSNFQANLRALIKQNLPLKEMIVSLNEIMVRITQGERFVTFFIGIYNKKTRHLEYINAGHNPQFVINDKGVQEMRTGCTIIGMFDKLPSIECGEMTFEKGSMIVHYTDGLTDLEAPDGRRFEVEGLLEFANKNHSLSAEEFKIKLLQRVDEFREGVPFNDDITIFVLKINE